MRKIGFVIPKGSPKWVIYYDEGAEFNRYRLYIEWREGQHCHKRLVEKYANLASCTDHIATYIRNHDEEER